MNAEIIENIRIEIPDSGDVLVVIREVSTGLYFAIDETYIEQSVVLVYSPYNNGPLSVGEDDVLEYVIHPAVLESVYKDNPHPLHSRQEWKYDVMNQNCLLSYWQWVSSRIKLTYKLKRDHLVEKDYLVE